jgi:sugar lactone lactonase YvrE
METATEYTVGEIKDGKAVPFPDAELNRIDIADPQNHLLSVMAAAVDSRNWLWLLDGGRLNRNLVPHGAKLVAVDLSTGRIVKNIPFPDDVILPTTILKDLAIDPAIGKSGFALIADSSPNGPSAIIVVDIDNGKSIRRLDRHPSVTAEPEFVIFADGHMVRVRSTEGQSSDWSAGVTGICISADGKSLYYSPMASRQIYQVSLRKLCDGKCSDADVAKTVQPMFQEIGTSDGLECDSKNRVYYSDVENDAIWRRNPDGMVDKIARDERLSWPDRLYLAPDGNLYATASQFHRSPWFHYGKDLRVKPYYLFRIKTDAEPVQLK